LTKKSILKTLTPFLGVKVFIGASAFKSAIKLEEKAVIIEKHQTPTTTLLNTAILQSIRELD